MTPGLTLTELFDALQAFTPELVGSGRARVLDVCQDSREVKPGALFVARRGQHSDGTRFVEAAIGAGAVAVLAERGTPVRWGVPTVLVDDVRRAIGFAAEAVHHEPSRSLSLIGITGTNGKTTTASLLRQCLEQLGHATLQIGTLGFEFAGEHRPGQLTTPEADAVSRALAAARDRGASCAVMEVSSHALEQRRVDALHFDVAAFTNLTQDHLDYHGTLADYGAAKARLFRELRPRHVVLDVDDAFGRALFSELEQRGQRAPGARAIAVGRGPAAHVRCERAELTPAGTELRFHTPAGEVEFHTALVGDHDVDNWLVVAGVLHALGFELERLVQIAPAVRPAPGRLERCETAADDVVVLVDYAHTPDALERVLRSARRIAETTGGQLWCVFGCGGDRDRGKRPLMGRLAVTFADRVIVTNDNPRTESPGDIAAEIESGMRDTPGAYSVSLDREEAIACAVRSASSKDVIVIAGKGHEDYQIIGEQRLPFDDRAVARRALAARRQERHGGEGS